MKENVTAEIVCSFSQEMTTNQIKEWNNWRHQMWNLCDRLKDISRLPSVHERYGKLMREVVEMMNEIPVISKKGEVWF